MNEVLQSREGDVLRQSVGDVLVRPNVVEIQTPTGDVLANEVVLDFYMLGASVDGGVLCEEDRTLVVDTQRRRKRHVIPKLIAERAKPLHLTAGIRRSLVLRLSGGERNRRLTSRDPRNSGACHQVDEAGL